MAKHLPPKDAAISIACSHFLSSKNFLIWRAFACIYFWTVLIWEEIRDSITSLLKLRKSLIYLTVWTVIICTIYMTLSLYVSYLHYKNINDGSHIRCARYCGYAEKVQCLAATASVTVAIAFWSLLWQSADMNDPLIYQEHGTTMLFTIIDFYLCYSIITFKSTVWLIIVFDSIYIIWSVIYQFLADDTIYSVIDWKKEPLAATI
eukprot:UN08748